MLVVANEAVDPRLRSAYVKLLHYLYIDAGTLQIRDLVLSRKWSDIEDKKHAAEIAKKMAKLVEPDDGDEGGHNKLKWRDDLIAWVHAYFHDGVDRLALTANAEHHAKLHGKLPYTGEALRDGETRVEAECHQNTLSKEVLRLVDAMVKYGFYSDRKMGQTLRKQLQHDLLELLLGTDGGTSSSEDAHHSDSHAHRIVTSAKSIAVHVLRDLLDVYTNDILSTLLKAFKTEFEHMKHHHLNAHADGALRSLACFKSSSTEFLWFRDLGRESGIPTDNFAYLMLELCEYQVGPKPRRGKGD